MALLLPSSLALIPSSSHSLVSPTHRCFPIASPNIAIRLPWKSLSNSVLPFQKKMQILTRASSEASGEESALPLPEKIEESVSVENLPLQSKQQQKYELAKKLKTNRILRRRKARLWRKRLLRKRGKWTIAKMKKWGEKTKAKKKKGKKRKY
ncbi:plastid-specific 50S ribosomal protein 5 [Carex rostrata]